MHRYRPEGLLLVEGVVERERDAPPQRQYQCLVMPLSSSPHHCRSTGRCVPGCAVAPLRQPSLSELDPAGLAATYPEVVVLLLCPSVALSVKTSTHQACPT